MAIFESLAQTVKRLAVGDRVKVTLRPELGRVPNPVEGRITQKDQAGNFWLESASGSVKVGAGDILSLTNFSR